ncbi:MAG: DUF1360 domain-containing protein [Actinomycetes bacterium]
MQHLQPIRAWLRQIWASYEEGADQAGGERPLRGYSALLAGYTGMCAAGGLAVRARGGAPERPSAADLALLSVATFRLSRVLTKDAVAAPIRAPFTTYQGTGGPGEVMEAPRPGPTRHAVGELVICPFCVSQWVGTAGLFALALFPRTTRWAMSGLSAIAVADALHFGYARLQQAEEQAEG